MCCCNQDNPRTKQPTLSTGDELIGNCLSLQYSGMQYEMLKSKLEEEKKKKINLKPLPFTCLLMRSGGMGASASHGKQLSEYCSRFLTSECLGEFVL